MIRRLKYHEVDWEKYQNCLENSEQYIFLAEKRYLDVIISNNWEVLVYKEYEAVMPIPLVKKIGINFVIMPLQTQQLGVFSNKDKTETNELFLKFLNKNYKVFYYAFNNKNEFISILKSKKNYFLKSNNYEEIRKKYSVHRRRNVRIIDKLKDKIVFSENFNLRNSEHFFIENIIGADKTSVKKRIFENMNALFNKDFLKVYDLYFENKLASQAFLLDNNKTLFLINFINDKNFTSYNTTSIILDQILQKTIETKDFSFNGSNISEIAEFYRRFGAEEQTYHIIENSKMGLIKRLL